MRFNNRNAQELYYYLFWIYLGASIFCSLMSIVLLIIFFLTGFNESLKISNLFLLSFIIMGAVYFRINAMHYHRILIENENRGEGFDESMKFSSSFNLSLFERLKHRSSDDRSGGKKKTNSKKKRREEF